MERRKALRIPAAEMFETLRTKMGNFNEIVVTEGSARMDVDVAIGLPMDHFSIMSLKEASDSLAYEFLKNQIQKWIQDLIFRSKTEGGTSETDKKDERPEAETSGTK
ncbi:hypothetical protein Mapa_013817 [Marchantia paleacea]|nr:hypothetical protein Mapa_013817 [Marchantia paleacea]